MKKSFLNPLLAVLAIFFAISFVSNARVLIVDNYKHATQFSTIDDALNYHNSHPLDAGEEDIVYLTGSPNPYSTSGNNIFSHLTIIGVGFNPKTPSGFSSTIVGNASPACCIDYSWIFWNSSYITFEGIKFVPNYSQHIYWYGLNHVKFNRCYFSTGICHFGISGGNFGGPQSNDIEITNCIFDNCTLDGDVQNSIPFTINSIISNNIFWYSEIKDFSGAQVYNNVFINDKNSSILSWINGSQFYNNIFYGASTSDFSNITTCNFKSNLKPGSVDLPPSGDGNSAEKNQNLGTGTSDFTNLVTSSTSWSTANDFRLQTGSAGKGKATDNGDIGIFSGQFHFPVFADGTTDYTGEPPELPVFRVFSILNDGDMFPTVSTNGQVQFQVRAIKK